MFKGNREGNILRGVVWSAWVDLSARLVIYAQTIPLNNGTSVRCQI